jgi:ribosomal protein L11 methyltransferase
MPWRALTLELDAGAAEAMSEALLESGAQSVALDRVDGPRPALTALLALELDARTVLEEAVRLAGLAATPAFAVEEVADEDWVRKTQAQFAPIEVGARLWVGPSWHEPPTGRAIVRLDPGMAFGTGTHPTTRLMLGFLEQQVRAAHSVLDYGCGSGILAIAAAKLGAVRVDAVDVDALAVEITAANAVGNRVAIRAGLPEALPAATYDIVVSNILAQPLILLAPLLAARTAAGGRIALAGILESQAAEVIEAYAPWVKLRVESLQEVWVLLAGTRAR